MSPSESLIRVFGVSPWSACCGFHSQASFIASGIWIEEFSEIQDVVSAPLT